MRYKFFLCLFSLKCPYLICFTILLNRFSHLSTWNRTKVMAAAVSTPTVFTVWVTHCVVGVSLPVSANLAAMTSASPVTVTTLQTGTTWLSCHHSAPTALTTSTVKPASTQKFASGGRMMLGVIVVAGIFFIYISSLIFFSTHFWLYSLDDII